MILNCSNMVLYETYICHHLNVARPIYFIFALLPVQSAHSFFHNVIGQIQKIVGIQAFEVLYYLF